MRRPTRDLALTMTVLWSLTYLGPGYAGEWVGGGELRVMSGGAVTAEPTCPECESQLPAPVPIAFAEAYSPRPPAWYFQADALALKREASKDRTFATLSRRAWAESLNPKYYVPSIGQPDTRTEEEKQKYIWLPTDSSAAVLTLNDTDYSRFQPGSRMLLGRTLGDEHAFEVSYFDVTKWTGTAVVHDTTEYVAEADRYTGAPITTYPASLFSPFSNFGNPPIDGLDYNNLAYISYSSSLSNLEWNLRRYVLRAPGYLQASVLIGGRYMNIGETLYYHTESAFPALGGSTTSATTDTNNNMMGVQIGGMYEMYFDPGWWLDCEVKGVLFNNNARQQTGFVHDGVDAYQGTHLDHAERDLIASAVDARLTATFLFSPRLALRASYQVLYVTGLALAPDNFSQDARTLSSGPATLVAGGNVLYHGLHLGLSCVW